eukprot:s21_g26.t1
MGLYRRNCNWGNWGMLRLFQLVALVVPVNGAVIEASNTSFVDLLAENEVVITMFYRSWCGHCKRLKPEYHRAAERLAATKSKVVLVQTQDDALFKQFEVKMVPSLWVFANGKQLYQHYAWEFDDVYDFAWSFDALHLPVGFIYRHYLRLRSLYRFGLKAALKAMKLKPDHPFQVYLPHVLAPALVGSVLVIVAPIALLLYDSAKKARKVEEKEKKS